MNVKIDHLQSFAAIARFGSFTQAAKMLHISQPALTNQINQLEASLDDIKLLNRNSRSVSLTKIGREMLPSALRIVEEMENFVLTAKKMSQSRECAVKIGAISSVASAILPLALTAFQDDYPTTRVQVTDAPSTRVLVLVRDEEVDFGIANLAQIPADIQTNVLFRDQLSVAFTHESHLSQKNAVKLQDLLDSPLIVMDAGTCNRKLLDEAFQSIGHFLKPRYEATRMDTAVAMAEAGLGIAILPSILFHGNRHDSLKVLPIDHDLLRRDVVVIQKLGHILSPEADAFLAQLRLCGESDSGRSGFSSRETAKM
jgi:DNA-binding transcriptional LysR family regulator